MKAALNERNLVRQTLDAEIPGYVPWFRNFRDERNALKEGIPAHTRGGEGPGIPVDYGLGFTDSGDHLQCDQVARPDRSVGDVSCGRESRSRTPEAPRGDVAEIRRRILVRSRVTVHSRTLMSLTSRRRTCARQSNRYPPI